MFSFQDEAFLKTLGECWNSFPDYMKNISELPKYFTVTDLKTPEFEFWTKIYDTVAAYNDCSKASLAYLQAQKKLTLAVVSATQTLFKKLSDKRKEPNPAGYFVSMTGLQPEVVRSEILGTCGKFLADSQKRKQFLDSVQPMKAALNPKPVEQSYGFGSASQMYSSSSRLNQSSRGGSTAQLPAPSQAHSEQSKELINSLQTESKEAKQAVKSAQEKQEAAELLAKQSENMLARHQIEGQRAYAILTAISDKNQASQGFSHIMQTFGLNVKDFL